MKIMIINPNTTSSFTDTIRKSCERYIGHDTELIVTNPNEGVASIEGSSDGIQAAYHLLNLIKANKHENIDGYVLACFDDTGLQAAREITSVPVVGIGEASLHIANLISARYSVITTLQRSVSILEDNASSYGLDKRCKGIHAVNLPVLALEEKALAFEAILIRSKEILEQDKSECIILGCGGMSGMAEPLSEALGVPVIDGTAAGIKLIEALVGMKLQTSKSCTYGYPNQK
ncbi:aspartate/glutamate racemase family protein [Photobacterium minamisatsumaniensis]|uniref:aspartate/glutamate racemase family protein n=1 Tax=Photobacterium minamisatsumaniensis TaxID=2910233 RepID=UPI003D109FCF